MSQLQLQLLWDNDIPANLEKRSSGRTCQQLVTAADTTACLKGQGNKLADSTFMSCGSLLVVVLDMAWRAKILVKLQK